MPGTRFTDIRRFATIDSTNRYLLGEARAGTPEGAVAVADYQSAGRGRLGRHWEAPPGTNLLVSVLLRPQVTVADRHLVPTAVALAAVEAIRGFGATGVGIKWPNDLVAPDGRKLAGVLAESDLGAGSDALAAAVVVGIGINANWPTDADDLPPELTGLAVSLRQLIGRPVDLDALLDAFLLALEPRVEDLTTATGRRALVEELTSTCDTLGTRVRVELPDGTLEGDAVGITPEGHLAVRTPNGDRTVVAGDVIHLRPGS